MPAPRSALVLVTLIAVATPLALRAQSVLDPSGHWEGTIEAPGTSVAVELDLARNARGELAGTITIPGEKLKGLPLQTITFKGRSLTFAARADQPFTGELSGDGQSVSGELTVSGTLVPVSFTRTGEARIEAPPRSAAIRRELEGHWHGTLPVQGGLRLLLKMANHPDGTATGSIVNLDQGSLEIPVVILQSGSTVAIESTVVASAFTGTVNADGTELAGTFSQGTAAVPLTFRRATEKQ